MEKFLVLVSGIYGTNLNFFNYSFLLAVISIDAMDLSGEHQINVQHNLYKRRLDYEGKPLEDPEKQLGNSNCHFNGKLCYAKYTIL